MHYPTHSVGQVLSVVGGRMTHVSCQGFMDDDEDGLYAPGLEAETLAASGDLPVERRQGTAAARTRSPGARAATWAAWTVYVLSLVGGLGAAGAARLGTGRWSLRAGRSAHVG